MHPLYDEFRPSARQRRQDMEADRYTALFDLVLNELEREFEEEGGLGEFKPSLATVHRIVELRMKEVRADEIG